MSASAQLRSGRAATRSASVRAGDGEAPKSIRVHVLDMLAAEDRDFGLAEMIDNIHAAGIQAHDDAVRSITIKLMKDGQVERVGRGQYRLARRGNPSATGTSAPVGPADATTSAEPQPDAEPEPALAAQPGQAGNADSAGAAESAESYTPPLNLGQAWQ